MSSEIEKKIVSIISEIAGADEGDISPDKDFFKDLEIDSVRAIEITVAIEKMFKISVRDEDVPKIATVRQAVELTEKLLGQRSA